MRWWCLVAGQMYMMKTSFFVHRIDFALPKFLVFFVVFVSNFLVSIFSSFHDFRSKNFEENVWKRKRKRLRANYYYFFFYHKMVSVTNGRPVCLAVHISIGFSFVFFVFIVFFSLFMRSKTINYRHRLLHCAVCEKKKWQTNKRIKSGFPSCNLRKF